MDNSFIPKAIDMVKDAIAADTNQEYEIALGLYKKSLEYFMTGLKYESNPVSASEGRLGCFFLYTFCVFFFRTARTGEGSTQNSSPCFLAAVFHNRPAPLACAQILQRFAVLAGVITPIPSSIRARKHHCRILILCILCSRFFRPKRADGFRRLAN